MDMGWQNLIGYTATVFGLFAFLPQVIKTAKAKETKDISLAMYLILWLGAALWLTYGVFIGKLPVIIVNAVVIMLVSVMLFFKIKYK